MAEKEGLHQRLKQAIVWLKQNKNILQLDIADKMSMSSVGFSRGLARCKEKNDENFVIKFHQATGEIFSLDWLLYGTGEKFTADIKKAEPTINPHQSAQTIDESSQINAAISAYIQLTNRLTDDLKKKEVEMAERLAEKDARIAELKDTIATKQEIIKAREDHIIELERQLAAATTGDLSRYPFAFGAAEHKEQPKIK